MSELVKRLRGPTWVMSCYSKSEHLYAAMREAMREAADALEAQAKRIAELEASLADSDEALQVLGLKLAHAEAEPSWTFNVFEGAPPKGSNSWTEFLTNSHQTKNYSGLILRSQLQDKNHSASAVVGPTPVTVAAPACEQPS